MLKKRCFTGEPYLRERASLTSSEDTNLGLPAEQHVNVTFKWSQNFCVVLFFSLDLQSECVFSFDLWVTQSPFELFKYAHTYTTHLHTQSTLSP